MADKYINATKMAERLKADCEKIKQASLPENIKEYQRQLRLAMVAFLDAEPSENVVPFQIPAWPICQNCGKPMVYCREEKAGKATWKRYACESCYNQSVAREDRHEEESNNGAGG